MIDGAPAATVPVPDFKDFGTKVPALLVYAEEECVHVAYGADIQPFLAWVESLGEIEPLHFKLVSAE